MQEVYCCNDVEGEVFCFVPLNFFSNLLNKSYDNACSKSRKKNRLKLVCVHHYCGCIVYLLLHGLGELVENCIDQSVATGFLVPLYIRLQCVEKTWACPWLINDHLSKHKKQSLEHYVNYLCTQLSLRELCDRNEIYILSQEFYYLWTNLGELL